SGLGRPSSRTCSALHGRPGRVSTQSSAESFLRTIGGCGETQEARSHRVHAQIAHDPQRDGQNQFGLAKDRSSKNSLTRKTVANAPAQQSAAWRAACGLSAIGGPSHVCALFNPYRLRTPASPPSDLRDGDGG